MIAQQIRVLIVDDSAVVRGLMARALETDPAISIVATAMHGEAALRSLRKQAVDVVILDIEMPVMDGLTALPLIQKEFPGVRVIVASASTQEGAETTIRALSMGAADCIAKPVASSTSESIEQLVQRLVPLVKALGASTGSAESASREATLSEIHRNASKRAFGSKPNIVVIGTSTGGPNALSKLVSGLPKDFPLPILIVQHMPPLFTPMLAKHIQQDGGRPCAEAKHGEPIERGHTYVAPGDFHLLIEKQGNRMVTVLNQAPPEHYCRPSVNPLFLSAAEWYGGNVLAVMLTGMGDDGIEGTRAIAARDGYIVAQDEKSSVVWGMPGAVVREQLAHKVAPLNDIASIISRVCTSAAVAR